MNIVIIDSGIKSSHSIFNDINMVHYRYDSSSMSWEKSENPVLSSGHGTGVASIVTNKLKDITVYSFEIFDENLQCSEKDLIECLEYIYINIECSLINMSLGTLKYNSKLYSICQKLKLKNVIVVAAFSNDGGISYPAAFNCVIGVDASLRCKKNDEFVYVKNSLINVKAKGLNQRVAWDKEEYVITQGASYACGYVANYIIRLLKKGISSYEDILKKIYEACVFVYNNQTYINKIHYKKFTRIAVFPYNKEVSSIVNMASIYQIHISGIYEHSRLGHIGMEVESIYSGKRYTIQNIKDCNWNDFDLMVIGHLDEQENRLNISLKKDILDMCLQHHKHVYSFDMHYMIEYKNKFDLQNLYFYYPEIEKKFNEMVNLNKLFSISVPIVAIFGTSKQQGKFTLQLLLREYLLKMGYKVGQIGTEPQSLLFDFDFSIPLGYESSNDMSRNELIPLVNYQLHEIEKKEVDIILVGSQSGTVPRAYNNMSYFNNQVLDFLCGVNPDVVILCINYHDEIDYIIRTINGIEAVGNCCVVALCMFPKGYLNDWDLMNDKKEKIDNHLLDIKKESIEERLGYPVFILGRKDVPEQIVEQLLIYFGGE